MDDHAGRPNSNLAAYEDRQQLAELWQGVGQGSLIGGLLQRLSLKGSVQNARVLNELVSERVRLEQGLTALAAARLEHGRARETLRGAKEIYAADADLRAAERAQAATRRKEAETLGEIRGMDLGMDLARKKREYEQFMSQGSGAGPAPEAETVSRSRAAEEVLKEFKHQNLANELRMANEQEIGNYIKAAGGKEGVTPEMEALFARSRAAVEEMIKANGLG